MGGWNTFQEFVDNQWQGDLGGAVEQVLTGAGLSPTEYRELQKLLEVRADHIQLRLLARIAQALEKGNGDRPE